MNRFDYIDRIKQKEGLRLKVYLDTENIPTGGWGHAFHVGSPMTLKIAELFLNMDLERVDRDYEKLGLFLDPVREYVIKDMLYQMGLGNDKKGLRSFKKFLSSVRVGDWKTAAFEVLDSDYGRKHTTRATENSHMILTGEYKGMP